MDHFSKHELDRYIKGSWIRLNKGERSALDFLFRHFYQELYDYGIRLKNDKNLIQDCIQELFLSLWIRREGLTTPDSVKAYLLVSLRNLVIDQVSSKRKQYDRDKIIKEELYKAPIFEEVFDTDTETDVIYKKKLERAFGQLNNRQREALFLRYYNGLSNKEIADIMEINYQSVKNNLSRAIQNLKTIVKTLTIFFLIICIRL